LSLQQVESSDSSQRSCNKFLDTSPRFVRLSRFTGSDVTDTSQDTVYRLRPGTRNCTTCFKTERIKKAVLYEFRPGLYLYSVG